MPSLGVVTTVPPKGPYLPTQPVDVEIHAVVVSAAQSPWDAVEKGPGVRNVIIVGGIVALGKAPIPGEIPGGGPQPGLVASDPGSKASQWLIDPAGRPEHHGYSDHELPDKD